ncbi:MAG: NADH:flavin oxidoreductase [Spirochaetales bacterium]|nr:NADH:flavin oxidoreductase [Spirochaetales bacterium]
MADFSRFNLKTANDLKKELDRLNLYLPMSDNYSLLGQALKIGSFTLPNRFVAQPMEGIDGNEETFAPSDLTFRRYKRFAEGGSGLIWFEAAVVEPEGRSNPRQLILTEENLDLWKRLVEETREAARKRWGHEIVTVIQLSHSGRWSKPQGKPQPVLIHHNPKLDKAVGVDESYPLVSDQELDRLRDLFIAKGELAARAGFDGIEMKAVHGYFTGEMLCAHTREGRYGGSYENRTRFVRDCTVGLKERLPAPHFVTARLTMLEPSPYPYGWGVKEEPGSLEPDLTEPLRFAKELTRAGEMPVFNFSLGYPRFAPYMNRPFDNPIAGAPKPPEHPLEGIVRFQNVGRELQKAIAPIPVATAALGWLRHLMPTVAAGLVEDNWFSLIGQGRQMFAYPESPADIMKNGTMAPKKCCLTCSLCSQIMKDVLGRNGCPIRDGEIYKEELKKGREAARAKGLP